jgi:hypothetical protein
LNCVSCSMMDPPAKTQFERCLAKRVENEELASVHGQEMISALIMMVKDGDDQQKLRRVGITAVTQRFRVHFETISNVWTHT